VKDAPLLPPFPAGQAADCEMLRLFEAVVYAYY
jgi:hypothetical protein